MIRHAAFSAFAVASFAASASAQPVFNQQSYACALTPPAYVIETNAPEHRNIRPLLLWNGVTIRQDPLDPSFPNDAYVQPHPAGPETFEYYRPEFLATFERLDAAGAVTVRGLQKVSSGAQNTKKRAFAYELKSVSGGQGNLFRGTITADLGAHRYPVECRLTVTTQTPPR